MFFNTPAFSGINPERRSDKWLLLTWAKIATSVYFLLVGEPSSDRMDQTCVLGCPYVKSGCQNMVLQYWTTGVFVTVHWTEIIYSCMNMSMDHSILRTTVPYPSYRKKCQNPGWLIHTHQATRQDWRLFLKQGLLYCLLLEQGHQPASTRWWYNDTTIESQDRHAGRQGWAVVLVVVGRAAVALRLARVVCSRYSVLPSTTVCVPTFKLTWLRTWQVTATAITEKMFKFRMVIAVAVPVAVAILDNLSIDWLVSVRIISTHWVAPLKSHSMTYLLANIWTVLMSINSAVLLLRR